MREREIGACDLEEFGDHHKKNKCSCWHYHNKIFVPETAAKVIIPVNPDSRELIIEILWTGT